MLTNKLIADPQQAAKFVSIVQGVHNCTQERAESIYMSEIEFFQGMLDKDPKLSACELTTLQNVFLDIITNGLTFSPYLKLVYIEPRWVKMNGHAQGGEMRLAWKPSPSGSVFLCQQAGSISHVSSPEIVYAGDTYNVRTINNLKTIHHERKGASTTIVACFVFVVLPNGTREAHELTISDDIARLRGYSERSNKGKGANPLYTSNNGQIDLGFLRSKTVSHSVKYYPKKQLIGSALIADDGDSIPDEIPVHSVVHNASDMMAVGGVIPNTDIPNIIPSAQQFNTPPVPVMNIGMDFSSTPPVTVQHTDLPTFNPPVFEVPPPYNALPQLPAFNLPGMQPGDSF